MKSSGTNDILDGDSAANAQADKPKKTEKSGSSKAQAIVSKMRAKSQGFAPETTVVQLPLWSETSRGLPNALARGAIFSARSPSEPRFLIKGEQLASLSNIQISYRGEDLRQDDSSVFMNLLHIARTQPLGNCVYFTGYSMLVDLRWGVNGPAYDKLKECIDRLSATSVTVIITINGKRHAFGKSLVRSFEWRDEVTKTPMAQWRVTLEPEIVNLFSENTFTLIEWEERRQIDSRASLALWLHSFFATHEKPYDYSVAKYYELSGSRVKSMFHFRSGLKKALSKLQKIGFLRSYQIDARDMVHVERHNRSHALPLAS